MVVFGYINKEDELCWCVCGEWHMQQEHCVFACVILFQMCHGENNCFQLVA